MSATPKTTRRAAFLAEMERVVPWSALRANRAILSEAGQWPPAGRGRADVPPLRLIRRLPLKRAALSVPGRHLITLNNSGHRAGGVPPARCSRAGAPNSARYAKACHRREPRRKALHLPPCIEIRLLKDELGACRVTNKSWTSVPGRLWVPSHSRAVRSI